MLLAIGLALLVLVGLGLLLRRPMTDAMLFYPSRGQDRTPQDLGLAYETVWLRAPDGVCTQAWWIPGTPGAPVIVFFHGNAGTMADRLENAAMLRGLGPTVFLVEYRGYGDSEGRPSEAGLEADAREAVREARRRAGPEGKIVLFGRSLGGAVAAYAASVERVDGLVLESTFTSLRAIAGRAVAIPFAGRLAAYDFDTASLMPSIACPVLVIHGEDDRLVPVAMGRKLYDLATRAPWRHFHEVPEGDHNDTYTLGGRPYRDAWVLLLANV